jgi:SHS2 domain-containing protein
LHAKGRGEKLDPERHQTRVDVKAVTLHRFSLKKTDDVWEGFVILDI